MVGWLVVVYEANNSTYHQPHHKNDSLHRRADGSDSFGAQGVAAEGEGGEETGEEVQVEEAIVEDGRLGAISGTS